MGLLLSSSHHLLNSRAFWLLSPPPSFVTILLIFFSKKKQLGHLYDNKKWTHLHSWKQKCFQVWGALLPSEGCAWDPHYGLALTNTRKFMPLEDNVKCVLYVLTCHVSVCMMYVCVHEYACIYCISNVSWTVELQVILILLQMSPPKAFH